MHGFTRRSTFPTRLVVFGLILVIFILLPWWILRPNENIVIHISDRLTKQADQIELEMNYAVTTTKRLIGSIEKLLGQLGNQLTNGAGSSLSTKRELDIDDVFKIWAKTEIKAGHTTFSGTFDINLILKLLYHQMGYFDYDLVVEDFVVKPAKKGNADDSGENTAERDNKRIYGLIKLYPHAGHGWRIPDTGATTPLTFRSMVAKSILDGVEGNVRSKDCKRNLCISEWPDMTSLEVTVDAFAFLSNWRADGGCKSPETDEECIKRIESVFRKALEADDKNNFARLGLGLAQLRHFQITSRNAPPVRSGRLLMEAVLNIKSAITKSEFLGHLLSTQEWAEFIRRTEGLTEFEIKKEFIDSADGYREARRAFVEADYSRAVKAISSVKCRPKPIVPHIQNFELSARLMAAESFTEAKPLLEEFEKMGDERQDITWKTSYAFVLCYWNNGDSDRAKKAISLIDEAIVWSNDSFVENLNLRAQKGLCLAMVNRKDDAIQLLHKVQKDIPTEVDSEENKDYMSVYYNSGIAFSLTGDQATAGKALEQAAILDQSYLHGVSHQKLLSAFREWDGYQEWKSKVLSLVKK